MHLCLSAIVSGFLFIACGVTSAWAETLPVEGVYPAESDEAAALQTIAIEQFGGLDGTDLSIRITDLLQMVEIQGERYFRIVPASLGRDEAQGVLRGTAYADSRHDRVRVKRKVCVLRNSEGKCVETDKREIVCTKRTVSYDYSIRLIGRRGENLFAASGRPEDTVTYCPDDKYVRSTEDSVRALAKGVAVRIRYALAPVYRREDIRVMEDRKGLDSDSASRFKSAVRMTKSNWSEACRMWRWLQEDNPNHAPTAFNVALCSEAEGNPDAATSAYARAAMLDGSSSYVRSGFERVDARKRAEAQLAAHRRK